MESQVRVTEARILQAQAVVRPGMGAAGARTARGAAVAVRRQNPVLVSST